MINGITQITSRALTIICEIVKSFKSVIQMITGLRRLTSRTLTIISEISKSLKSVIQTKVITAN